MATQTDPQDRPEIRTTNDLLTAMRAGIEIATRSDIYESERRVTERVDERLNAQDRRTDARFDAQDARMDDRDRWIAERFDAQDRRTDARFDAQDARFDAQDRRMDAQDRRMDSFETRLNENTAATNENTAAIRELTAASEAERRTKNRAIQWLSIGLAGLGTIAGILGGVAALLSAAN